MKIVTFNAVQFNKIIDGIVLSGAKYSKGIGQALLGALYFSIAEQDPAPANTLVGALRKSTKQQAIIDLLQDCGNLCWSKTDPANVGGKDKKEAQFFFFDAMHAWLPEDVAKLRDTCNAWEDYKTAPVKKTYNAVKAVEAIIKAVESKEGKGDTVIGKDMLAGLKKALAKHYADMMVEDAATLAAIESAV